MCPKLLNTAMMASNKLLSDFKSYKSSFIIDLVNMVHHYTYVFYDFGDMCLILIPT